MNTRRVDKNDTKKVFLKLGTCSRTFFYLLNREFGHQMALEERAADPLAGGVLQKGHQCGMLWGASLAVGAASFRRCNDHDQAISVAVSTTQHLLESFSNRTNTVNCRTITDTDFSKKWEMLKYILFKAKYCFNLAEKWAPEAIEAAKEGLSLEQVLSKKPISCASEVVQKMGASNEEMVMVSGFAGGLGLGGNACGALSAAIWMNTLSWSKEYPKKSALSNPKAKKTFKVFSAETNSEIICHKICGKHFKNLDDHSEFLKKGGCKKLINVLANA